MKKINEEKAMIIYDFLDSSKLFKGTVVPEARSLMNIPFITGNEALDAKFVSEAKKLVYGEVGIDMLAGPTEVFIIAAYVTDNICLHF